MVIARIVENTKMNDFTKEELERLQHALEEYIAEDPSWRNGDGSWNPYDDKLFMKLTSLIDNYCEHKESKIGIIAKDIKDIE
jgi:hypothetical protein